MVIKKRKARRVKKKKPVAPPVDKIGLSLREASLVSSLGQSSLLGAIKARQLMCRKFGSRNLIMREDLITFLNSLPAAVA